MEERGTEDAKLLYGEEGGGGVNRLRGRTDEERTIGGSRSGLREQQLARKLARIDAFMVAYGIVVLRQLRSPRCLDAVGEGWLNLESKTDFRVLCPTKS